MPVSNPPSNNRASTSPSRPPGSSVTDQALTSSVARRRRARRLLTVTAALAAVSLSIPAATAQKPFYKAKNVTTAASSEARVSAAAAGAAAVTGDLKVGVFPDSSTWTNNGITSYYIQPSQNGTKFPMKSTKAALAKGVSINMALSAKGTSNIAGIASGSASAMSWLNAYIANVKTLSDYSKSLNNGTYVVATLQHEAVAAVNQGLLTGSSTNMTTIGKAQQIAIRLGKANAPNAAWSVWIVGYNRDQEATQLAQITNPKPDLISWDPYSNHNCSDTLSDIASGDVAWMKQQPAYTGALALSESGVSNSCSDSQMAAFYKDLPTKMRAFDPDLLFFVAFNSNAGGYDHVISSSKTQAIAALKASLTR